MDAVFCGSPLSPLSAAAAECLDREMTLRLVIVPPAGQDIRKRLDDGWLYTLSLVVVGCFRLLNCLLRKVGIKRAKGYTCLKEYLIDHPDIPVASWDGHGDGLRCLVERSGIPRDGRVGVLVSCVYPYRLPDRLDGFGCLVNIHPGLLPENRGPMPHFWALTRREVVSGIAFHRLARNWDAGDILYQRHFRIDHRYSEFGVEKLAQEALTGSASVVFRDLRFYWNAAVPQQGGSYYKKPSNVDRLAERRRSVIRWRDVMGLWST